MTTKAEQLRAMREASFKRAKPVTVGDLRKAVAAVNKTIAGAKPKKAKRKR
jgi:3-methyladenine DNA glycosylase Tag